MLGELTMKAKYKGFHLVVTSLLISAAVLIGAVPAVCYGEAMQDPVPSGIDGMIESINVPFDESANVAKIGTSCEKVLVGQRVPASENPVSRFDVSSGMENTLSNLDLVTESISSNPGLMSDEDYYWLLRIVEAEAGEDDVKARTMVANVIMNRVAEPEFPNTVTEVIFEYVNGVPQFAPTYDGTIYTVDVTDETREAVRDALHGADYSEGALFFVMKSAADSFSWFDTDLKWLYKYGVHDFYTYPDTIDMKKNADNDRDRLTDVSLETPAEDD